MDSTNRTLLGNVQNGDRVAWQTFVDIYTPLLLKYARIRGLSDDDANDIAQTVFVQLVQSMQQFNYNPAKGRFRGYLRTAVNREIPRFLAQRRRQFSKTIAPKELEKASSSDPWSKKWEIAIFRVALERLRKQISKRNWRVFKRAWLDNVPPSKIAEAEGKSPQWVAKIKFRIKQMLKREIELLSDESPFLE